MRYLKEHPVLDISERKMVSFTFNGIPCMGVETQALASALIANGYLTFSHHHKDHSPEGLFCANGQCSHCTVLVDGKPEKACVTPLKAGMKVRSMEGYPTLPEDNAPLSGSIKKQLNCDVLVIGAGPSGLNAALELAQLGYEVLLVDDKTNSGGKLLLQTHKFFGSVKDCYAGTRGVDIAAILEKKVKDHKNIHLMLNTTVAGIFKDRKAGLYQNNSHYFIAGFKGLIVSAGAREKSLIFPGNHLPGIFGAGAFQTVVNRDLVKASDRIFIVGSGNVGLIAAYHALQAGIKVLGICDVLPEPGGYKVHADKIRRMGVPIYLKHTVLTADGDEKLEHISIAEVNEHYEPILETSKTFTVDTLLVAVGLAPVDEFYSMAEQFNFPVVKAGDAQEIAEASSAMFGGRIAGLQMAKKLGNKIEISPELIEKTALLKSHPGRIYPQQKIILSDTYSPIISCTQEIPCNPCETVCPVHAIRLSDKKGNLLDVPQYTGGCIGCMKCVTICPGLAITLAKKLDDDFAEIVLPHEFIPDFKPGDSIPLTDREGNFLENAQVLWIKLNKRSRTHLLACKVSLKNAVTAAGIRVQDLSVSRPEENLSLPYLPDNGIVCRCERVTVGEIKKFIKDHHVRDMNQLKTLRVGMGSCGGRNCSLLLSRVFREAGVDPQDVVSSSHRPLSVEIPMGQLINEGSDPASNKGDR